MADDDIQNAIDEEILNDYSKLKKERSKKQRILVGDEEKLNITDNNIDRLRKEEEDLKEQLELQRKENFSLQASIDSLQATLTKKLEDLKNAESHLSEIYQGIWADRENFCVKADEINEEFGIMSEWWKSQLEFVSDLENLRKKRASNKKSQKEMEACQNNLSKIKKEINFLSEEKEEDAEILAFESVDSETERIEDDFDEPATNETKLFPIFKPLKKPRVSEFEKGDIGRPAEVDEFVNDKFFEMMDVEKVRMINKKKNAKKLY